MAFHCSNEKNIHKVRNLGNHGNAGLQKFLNSPNFFAFLVTSILMNFLSYLFDQGLGSVNDPRRIRTKYFIRVAIDWIGRCVFNDSFCQNEN